MKRLLSALKPFRLHLIRVACGALVALVLPVCMVASAQDFDYAYSSQFGSYGSGNGQFFNLNFVAVDPAAHDILVVDDGNNRVEIFSSDGTYLRQFGSQGTGNGQFNGVGGVAVDPASHNIVVADGDGRIQIFNPAGNYLSQFGSPGSGNGQFNGPATIAIDPVSRNIVVADLNNYRVQIFSTNGTYLGQFGSPGSGNGQFSYALYLAIDPNTHEILVGDEINSNLQFFTSSGIYLRQFGSFGSGNGQFSNCPCGLAVDATSGNILVVDYGNSRVQVFDANGGYLGQFGSPGNGNGQFNASNGPTGLDLDQVSHKVVVLDRGNSRAEIFAPSSVPPPPSCGPTQVSLSIEPLTATLSQSLYFSAQAFITAPFAGTVSFIVDGAGAACTANMTDVTASCLHPLQLGMHNVVAQYSGDGIFNPPGCSAPQSVTVVPDGGQNPTNVTCPILPNPAVQGQSVSMVCSVGNGAEPDSIAGMGQPDTVSATGYVTISQGPNVLAYAPVFNGTSVYSTVLGGGSYALTVTYSGDGSNATSAVNVPVTVTTPSDDIFYDGFDPPPN